MRHDRWSRLAPVVPRDTIALAQKAGRVQEPFDVISLGGFNLLDLLYPLCDVISLVGFNLLDLLALLVYPLCACIIAYFFYPSRLAIDVDMAKEQFKDRGF